jgi:hypothetical protein
VPNASLVCVKQVFVRHGPDPDNAIVRHPFIMRDAFLRVVCYGVGPYVRKVLARSFAFEKAASAEATFSIDRIKFPVIAQLTIPVNFPLLRQSSAERIIMPCSWSTCVW